MPIVLPDPEMLVDMPWHSRDAAIRRAHRLLRDYGLMAQPAAVERWRATREAQAVKHADWAAGIREEARVIHADLGEDPHAAEHLRDVMAATA